ncbi:hypothetical protein V8C43DRAFT_309265 [Trichoderma afarasin]
MDNSQTGFTTSSIHPMAPAIPGPPSVSMGSGETLLLGGIIFGNGYRVYTPILTRFHSPDSWSSFTSGEINPYAYCLGDPVNRIDPSGHWGFLKKIGAWFKKS